MVFCYNPTAARLARLHTVTMFRHRVVVLPLTHIYRFGRFMKDAPVGAAFTESFVEAFKRRLKGCRA